MEGRILIDSTCVATINAPIERIDLTTWLFTLTDTEYQRCSSAHIDAGTTRDAEGKRVSLNVELIGPNLYVQHYHERISGRTHCETRSMSDLISKLERSKIEILWSLSVRPLDAVVELYGADPKNNPDYSRVISPAAVKRLASLIDPGKVVYGGESDAAARYLDPTILYPISWSDKIMEDEIFEPLFPMLTYSDLGALIAKIRSMPKPLAGYVFSRNQQAIDHVLQSLSFGGGAVNQTNVFLFIESMPYGGVGTSGIGNYYGRYGYDSLTLAKSVLKSPPDVAIDHLFPPYTKGKVQALDRWFEY